MDARPPPEVTIEGGPGWQLEGPREALGPGDDDQEPQARGSWLDRHRVGGLVLAGLVGFAAATALAEARLTTVEESPEGVLSLEVRGDQADFGSSVVADADGRPALTTSVVVRNTGPRTVAFESAELVGTPYRSDGLAGRRVAPDGSTVVALLRSIDCDDLARTRAPGPLRIRATTGAGTRTVDLRMSTEVLQFHDEQVRGSCGQAPPDQAVVVEERRSAVDGRVLRLEVFLSNGSSQQLELASLTPAPGLRVARLTARDGSGLRDEPDPVVLPLALPPGDFDPPVDVFQGRGPEVGLAVELEVADCAVLDPPSPDFYVPAVTFQVTGAQGSNGFGGDPALLRQLQLAACGEQPPASGSTVAPTSAEQEQRAEDAAERRYFALRRDHPFLTPD